MGSMLLSDLEQAELASRARRLAAAAEGDRRVEAARVAAAQIEANAEHEIDVALAALRDRYRRQGDAEVAAVETELSQIESTVGGGDAPWPGFDTAVATVVAAVLGETRV